MKHYMFGLIIGMALCAHSSQAAVSIATNAISFRTAIKANDNLLNVGSDRYVYYTGTSNQSVIGSVPHVYQGGTGYWLYFDGSGAYAGSNMPCGIYVTNYNGDILASHWTYGPATTGNWEAAINLTTAQVPQWAFLTAEVDLSPNASGTVNGGRFYGVTINNY